MSTAAETLAIHRLPDDGSPLASLRREAFAHFETLGIPTRKLESWKGTNLASLEAMSFVAQDTPKSALETLRSDSPPDISLDGQALLFINGRPADSGSAGASGGVSGLTISSLADAAGSKNSATKIFRHLAQGVEAKTNGLVALQTAFLEDGAVVEIDAGAEIEEPIHLCFVSTGASSESQPEGAAAAFPRLLVLAGERSRATLLVEHITLGGDSSPGLTAFVAETVLEAGARLEMIEVQGETRGRVHFTSQHARVARDARIDAHVFSLGAGLVRSELTVLLEEAGGEARMNGLFIGRGDGHIDHFTTVDHAADHCTSDQEYRGVLTDSSKGVFRGRVIVRPGSQKTDARQSNPNLLLSERSMIDTKPQLEIYADDVKASHGSTIGQLDADALFFLRARGIDEDTARVLLTRGFAQGIVDGIGHPAVREALSQRIESTLALLASQAMPAGDLS